MTGAGQPAAAEPGPSEPILTAPRDDPGEAQSTAHDGGATAIASHVPALASALGLVVVGIAALSLARRRGVRHREISLPGVGALSPATLAVIGFSALVGAYHVVVYSLGIEGFRAPAGVLLSVIGVAVGASLAMDAVESRRQPKDSTE